MQEQNPDIEKLLSHIRPLAESLNGLHQKMHNLAMDEARNILSEQSKDLKRIEYFLDTFLSLTMFGVGEKKFLAFLQYTYQVDEDVDLTPSYFTKKLSKIKSLVCKWQILPSITLFFRQVITIIILKNALLRRKPAHFRPSGEPLQISYFR